ncbi:16S rRNA (guanine(527)-N(7))-methyltransferase RsmG [Roseiconus nitratireducens]|uniref:Ribosomal RNA small subunit methyltransferase G n=1 Tax=Roseiconus nitratireducens TaxID=2605748 RepID=A0A5M6DA07_9BACT|nr:16S rRNA (guanine(527)-N(7))-methyltransferase RsmG [Roseiconus nitratireducens]KAA5543260.1 16S rRNA (guanine(527)-N(7))-methyltransferase RsmG [Roseiconus nitratireducens]
MSLDPDFAAALQSRSIELDEEVAQRLQSYVLAMWRWNEQLNLTRHTTWDLFVGRDLRDCLQLAPLLSPGEEVLDLGSGNGVPGIPLAILRDDLDVSLAESVAKRAKVLSEMIDELGLPVPVYASRGEDLLDDFRFSTLVCRAVGSVAKLCRWIEPHWTNIDRMLLIKGPRWVEERNEARHLGLMNELQMRKVASYPLGDEPPSDDRPAADEADSDADADSDSSSDQGVIIQIWPKGRVLTVGN